MQNLSFGENGAPTTVVDYDDENFLDIERYSLAILLFLHVDDEIVAMVVVRDKMRWLIMKRCC